MNQLRLACLGTPEVRYNGQPVAFRTRKALALLIYLTVEGGMVARETLTALFWPDSDESHSRTMLRSTLFYIRQILDEVSDDWLIAERQAVALTPQANVELGLHTVQAALDLTPKPQSDQTQTITQLQAAVSLYRDDFLAGFSLPDTPDFDDWASLHREMWHRRMGQIFDELSTRQSQNGAHTQAVETTTRWLAHDSLNEIPYRRLMQLHFAVGDRTAALQTYNTCRVMLAKEFGANPAPETEALAAQIRLKAREAGGGLKVSSFSPHPSSFSFVGRAAEHHQLVTAYYTARQGQPQLVILAGEAGIGKTRLATEFLGWAATQEADLLQGRAFESGGRLPYQPIAQALRSRLEQENAPEDLLSDVWLVELSRLLPELRDRYPDLPVPSREEGTRRTRLFEAVARLTQALAQRRPLVFFIDDLHWTDEASLDLLHYSLASWLEAQTPVLVLLTLRQENLGVSPELQLWLANLTRQLTVTRLNLAALSLTETRQLITSLVAPAENSTALQEFEQWLFAETGGQPFYLTETLKLLMDQRLLTPQTDIAPGAVDVAA